MRPAWHLKNGEQSGERRSGMRRAVRSGSVLGATTVGLTVVSTLALLAFRAGQVQIFETAYTINVVCYAVAAFRAVRGTGRIEQATLDALVAATWAGALGTVLQGALVGTLDAAIGVAIAVMLVIEWLSAIIIAPVCGWVGYLSRRVAPVRAPGTASAPRATIESGTTAAG
jgi:hypothetical protein